MNWGIISTGVIANKFAGTVAAMDGEKIVAVSSRDGRRAAEFAKEHNIARAYASYGEMLSDPDIEAVYIATPNNMHFENGVACLEAGKNILCEKPFATCAQDAEKLYALADSKGLFAMEGMWIRFLPLYSELLKIIKTKTYGKLIHARCDYGFIAQGARRERKFLSSLGGGALLDIGVYNLCFLLTVMGGNPLSFTSNVQMNEYGTDGISSLQLAFSGGRTAQCMQAIGLAAERQAALYFEKAAIYLPDFQAAYSMTVKPVGGEAYTLSRPAEINGFEYEIREAAECVRAGKTHSDVYTPEDSVAVLRLTDAIRKSWNMKFSFEQTAKSDGGN